jgi:hypothetical protein
MTQASYDLARLRLNGLLTRRPHPSTWRPQPRRAEVRIFYTKVDHRRVAHERSSGVSVSQRDDEGLGAGTGVRGLGPPT